MINIDTNPEKLENMKNYVGEFQKEIKLAANDLTAAAKCFKEQNSDDISDVIKTTDDVVKAIEDYNQEFKDLRNIIEDYQNRLDKMLKKLHWRT